MRQDRSDAVTTDRQSEAGSAQAERVLRERELLDEARRDMAAGRVIEGERLDRWLAWFASDAPDEAEPE